ncbi:MAG TPA: hypothetical protein VGE71_04465 [Flavobacterium sp.]
MMFLQGYSEESGDGKEKKTTKKEERFFIVPPLNYLFKILQLCNLYSSSYRSIADNSSVGFKESGYIG